MDVKKTTVTGWVIAVVAGDHGYAGEGDGSFANDRQQENLTYPRKNTPGHRPLYDTSSP